MSNEAVVHYKAFIHNLYPPKSMIIVKTFNGVKYFKWIKLPELKALLDAL